MATNQLHRGRLIDHVQLVVRDFKASETFYEAVMSVLDIPVFVMGDDYLMADELVVSSVGSATASGHLTGRYHLAFQAKDRATVDAFYSAALAHGGVPRADARGASSCAAVPVKHALHEAMQHSVVAGHAWATFSLI